VCRLLWVLRCHGCRRLGRRIQWCYICSEVAEKSDRCPATHRVSGGVDNSTSKIAGNAKDGSAGFLNASIDVAA
jgi:uncharacterized Fe-S cluster-containing MiaB family protein